MRKLLLVFVMLLALSGTASAQTELCYKDLCIGMDESEANRFVGGTDPSAAEKYASIGNVAVQKPLLLFSEGKLATIFVLLQSPKDYNRLRKALIEKWGKPTGTQKERKKKSSGAPRKVIDIWLKKDGLIGYEKTSGPSEESVSYMITNNEMVDKLLQEVNKSDVEKGL